MNIPMNMTKFDILILIEAHANRIKQSAKELNVVWDTKALDALGMELDTRPNQLALDMIAESIEDIRHLFLAYNELLAVDQYVGENNEDWLGLDDVDDEELTDEELIKEQEEEAD